MPRREIFLSLMLALCAAALVGASTLDVENVVEIQERVEVQTEQAEAPVDPHTGLPSIQWVDVPIPVGPDDDDGGSGGGGGGYICSTSFQCPGDASIGVDPYTISCQGRYSCQTFSCGIKCDGNGIGCIPGPMC